MSQGFDMANGEFDMLYLCDGGGWGAMIFSFDKSTPLEGGGSQKDYRGGRASK